MLKRFTARWTLLLALVWLTPGLARGEDIWRLAGTFNGWSTGDDAWRMTPMQGDPAGARFEIKRRIAPGSYAFKFVKNGAWERGHLGAAKNLGKGRLESPGDDNHLRIHADAVYRITLDVKERAWGFEVSEVDAPVAIARVFGEPVVGQPMVIDLTASMWPGQRAGVPAGWVVTTSGEAAAALEKIEPKRQYRVTPSKPGVMHIRYDLSVGKQRSQNTLTLHVKEAALPTEGTVIEFTPKEEDGVWSAALIGDFNSWASPEASGVQNEGVTAMRSRADGSFFVGLHLPDGAYRYRVRVNGDEDILDPGNTRAPVTGEDGRPASLLIVGKSPEDYPPVRPRHIQDEAMRHDPAQARDFRAISADLGLFDVSVCTLPGDVEQAFVHIDAAEGAIGPALGVSPGATPKGKTRLSIPMHKTADLSGFDRWTARVMTGVSSDRVTYAIALKDGGAEFISRNYTVNAVPALRHPSWAMGAVWYQIFPDRFRNGNPLNDPHGPGVTLMPWNSDWYRVSEEEASAWKRRAGLKPEDPMPSRRGGPLYNVVWDRRYGGDLQGIEEKFAYLKDLGVTAIYMNPIFEAESMHKYDATDYRHIDDNFGTPKEAGRVPEAWTHTGEPGDDPSTWSWTPADRYFVDRFLPEAKKAGLRIVLDGVFNHTGRPFWAFQDIERHGIHSRYKDYFFVRFDEAGKLASWESWFNTGALPKFRQEANGDLVPAVKKHIFDITTRWMDPNGDGKPDDGIDGWRLDVALDVGLPFWRDWRKHVKSINPDAVIIAEIWDDASPHMRGDTFDTQMNYPFAKPVTDWLAVRPGMTSTQLQGRLRLAFDDAPQTNLIHQNLFGSHDTDRYVSMLFNPGREYDGRNRLQDEDGSDYKQTRPPKEIYDLSLLGVAIQATYLGSPMIYYGDEVGVYGADDPTDRKPFPWPDTGEPENPNDAADWGMHRAYQRWFALRHDKLAGPVLRYGTLRHLAGTPENVFAYTRELNGVRVVTVVNKGGQPFDASELLPSDLDQRTVDPVSARTWVIP